MRYEKEQLAAAMEFPGIEWEDKDTHDKHLSVIDFKKEQQSKEITEPEVINVKKQRQVKLKELLIKELTPAVKNIEQLAVQFSDDPERILSK